jgi:L-asparaginase|tara:strand:+ start:8257 stop:8745 length:489 start_codon:yes stop_codon:yes gene_type:complete
MIKIFTTGGTIDDYHYDSVDKAPTSHKSFVPELLKRARVTVKCEVEEIVHKDSRFVTDDDREIIFKKCQDCKEDKIIITHGTATMPITAKFLGKNNIEKTIVLTGSGFPANKENSDALFNLGAALTAVQALPNGVYVVMNGKIFTWDNVKKNVETGFFETER